MTMHRKMFALVVSASLLLVSVPGMAAPAAWSAEARQGAGTVVQKAVRLLATALRAPGLPKVIRFLTREGATSEQIQSVVKYAAPTAGILENLSKLDQLSLAFVRGQVEGLLVKFGATQVDASRVAYWVEKALDWGL